MKCKYCIWELLKSHKTCSYCGNDLSLFKKKKEIIPDHKDEIIKELQLKVEHLEKSNLELIETIKKLKLKINEHDIYKIEFVDKLDGIEFEEYIKVLLEKLGYDNVYTTPASNDYGADVIAEKDGIKYAIQCKNYKETKEYGR